MQKKKTHEEFIEDLKVRNPKAYESLEFLEKYNGNHTKILAKNKYGNVLATPGHLLSGIQPTIKSAIDKTAYFVSMAKEVHGDLYNYSKVEYKKNNIKIEIICNKHGIFTQIPVAHLNDKGCPKCGSQSAALKQSFTQEEVIKKIIEKYGDKYDLSKVKYKNSHAKILIGCKEHGHGYFKISLSSLIIGRGCPKCAGHFKEEYAKNNIPLYETFYKDFEFVGIKCRRKEEDENILEVQCHLCKKWFVPTYSATRNKKQFISGTAKGDGELNLYCSEECKILCPTFGFRTDSIDPRSKLYIDKTESQKARACQTNVIKQLQCQNDGKLYCERCGNEIFSMDAELHHTLPVAKFGLKASDHESQMLVCTKCHLELHNNCK